MIALKSALLEAEGFPHGFFLRQGGVSSGPYRSLNFISASGDAVENVRQNVERAAAFLGVLPDRVYYLSQVHGVAVEALFGTEEPSEVVRRVGDATMSDVPGVACGVRSADCGTLLLGDRRAGRVAAVHAGWRGTVSGVVGAAVRALGAAGSRPDDLVVAIGPHIESCCFEVGDDVAEEIAGSAPNRDGVVIRKEGEKPRVDLRAVLVSQLASLGIDSHRIDHVRGCTVCDEERFFSYRRDGKVSGRLLSAIVPRG
ncbi:MAG: peptidoglycan editing factor PgeF [Polyangiaceae bacterium]|nr:peptidoglycan editing factor PgeF [Polyangiaceae bacterium]